MDIVTHAMSGVILASPLARTTPLTAAALVFGCVLPDLDVLSRSFGKTAFLRWHQTYTHSLPIIAIVTGVSWLIWSWLGLPEPWAPLALGAGLALHTLQDVTNTYGVGMLTPFRRRRYALAWVFFIDALVVAVSAVAVVPAGKSFFPRGASGGGWTLGYGVFLAAYWSIRWAIRHRAGRLQPQGTRTLVPSALVPWRFYGYALVEGRPRVFELNAIRGAVRDQGEYDVFDGQYAHWLANVPEDRRMRELSPGYHVVAARKHDGKTTLVCRDLRTRNFGGKFGMLEITFDSAGQVEAKVFHV